MDEQTLQNPTPAEAAQPKHHHQRLGTRAAVAMATGFVGAKLGIIGLVIDARPLLKETPRGNPLQQLAALKSVVEGAIAREPNMLKGTFKVARYWTSLTIIGAVPFAILGWVRAEKMGGFKQVVHHPIRSTKILLGIENPPPPAAPEPAAPLPRYDAAPAAPEEPQKRFTDSIRPRAGASHQEALAQEQAEPAAVTQR